MLSLAYGAGPPPDPAPVDPTTSQSPALIGIGNFNTLQQLS